MIRIPSHELFLSDMHVHTKYCNHAVGEMEDYVLSAINKGFRLIGFSEHIETARYHRKNWLDKGELLIYHNEGLMLREKYKEKIKILIGIEVGLDPENYDTTNRLISLKPWDYVGLSHHYLYYNDKCINFASTVPEEINKVKESGLNALTSRYFQNLLDGIQKISRKDFLFHFDLPKKSHPDLIFSTSDLHIIDEIIDLAAKMDIGFEINSCGFDTLCRSQFPGDSILKKILAAKINVVIGSDSHAPEQIGRHFEKIKEKYIFSKS